MTYNGMRFDDNALTGFGRSFVKTGFLRGYGYVNGGTTGYFGKKAKGNAYADLREALKSGDLAKIVTIAKKLPSVEVRIETNYPGNCNYGFKVSRNGCLLFVAPYIGKA